MTESPQIIDPEFVIGREMSGGLWLVGLLFSNREAGEAAMRSIIELYNSTAGLAGAGGEPTPTKED